MRYFLLIIVLLFPVGCTSPDFDTSVHVMAWLKSLDPPLSRSHLGVAGFAMITAMCSSIA